MIRFSPWLFFVVVAFLFASGVSVGQSAVLRAEDVPASDAPTTAPAAPAIVESKTGIWGVMELVPIVLELPENYATVAQAINFHDRWTFAGMDREAALAYLGSIGFSADELAAMREANWADVDHACSVEAPDAVMLSMTPDTRGALYSKLMTDPANEHSVDPAWFRVGRVDSRLRGSELSDASVNLLKRLLYAGADDTLLFNDIKPAVRSITDPAEQMRFIRTITRKHAMVARLKIDETTDTAALAAYWGRGGRQENLQPLLDSYKYNAVAGLERPGKINVAMLLPPFVQERLYHHADLTTTAGRTPDDCYWSTFNFFCDVPDDRVHDMAYLTGLLQRDYDRIAEPSQLGDVILIGDGNGNVMHAANYIAEEIVFTKNGGSSRQPWILTRMRDVITQYRIKNPTLKVAYFRKRGL